MAKNKKKPAATKAVHQSQHRSKETVSAASKSSQQAEAAIKSDSKTKNKAAKSIKNSKAPTLNDTGYLWSMSYACPIGQSAHWFQTLIAAFFGACVIMIVHLHDYERNMAQFYWSSGNNNLSDFFSWYKMLAIIICAVLAALTLLYRLCTQSLAIKPSFAYIPMLVYSVFVIASYIHSDYKEFALWGYNDRFEGTLTLLAYMVMLFFIINSVNTEANIKQIIYPLAVTSAMLGILGLTQAFDIDFFRTALGQKLILPNGIVEITDSFLSNSFGAALNDAGLLTESSYTVNQLINMGKSIGVNYLDFTFTNKEIYQTVYNINYVSFYLTLLVPLFGMLFIRSIMLGKEEKLWKKIIWGALFALLIFNLIGSASSGGMLGMAFVVLAAIILFNKKLLEWWKPILVLVLISAVIFGATFNRWGSELTHAANSVLGIKSTSEAGDDTNAAVQHTLTYIDTDGFDVYIGIDDEELHMTMSYDNPEQIKILDGDGIAVDAVGTEVESLMAFNDERFSNCYLQPARDEKGNNYYIFTHDHQENNWAFRITKNGVFYLNNLGHLVDMDKIPSIGWENNPRWGSGRGYIFSRTIPMMKDTILLGYGADTYCLHFPHKDYVGKLNSGSYSDNINIIVDKAHNMYMGAWIGTGGISVIALIALFGIYLVQSFVLYIKNRFDKNDFGAYAGVGIFLGICGFLVTALVDDSSVSVMPMFYTLLGTGIAVNAFIKRRQRLTNE